MASQPEAEFEPKQESEPTFGTEEVQSEGIAEAEPQPVEVLTPPLVIIGLIGIGLLVLSCVTQHRWWRKCLSRKYKSKHGITSASVGCIATKSSTISSSTKNSLSIILEDAVQPPSFFNQEDLETMEEFSTFSNRPLSLLKVSLPAVLSLAVCPVTLFLYRPLVNFLWDPKDFPVIPNINDAIACFLTPSGLVYAIAYGFAFQEAMSRQQSIAERINSKMIILEQILVLLRDGDCIKKASTPSALLALKKEAIAWLCELLGKTSCKMGFKGHLRQILNATKNIQTPLSDKLRDHIFSLDSMSFDRTTHHMYIIQWLFLEVLGFFSFFGILLIKADSYKLELMMCILTVFSISAFCYVLADLDEPYHGVFRVDMDGLVDYLHDLEREYSLLQEKKGKQNAK